MEFNVTDWKVGCFSAGGFASESARLKLEDRFMGIVEVSGSYDRQSVSFQLNKNHRLHRWLKYKEGFSSDLVKGLLEEFGVRAGGLVMDPFMGSGTTAMVCMMNGINCMGFDILPTSGVAIEAKKNVFEYNLDELYEIGRKLKHMECPSGYDKSFRYIPITEGAFPEITGREIVFFHGMD